MLEDKVVGYFDRYPDLKVLFFFDENQENREDVEKMVLPNIHIEIYSNNAFTIKCKLIDEWSEKKVLLYLPQAHPNNQEEYHNFPLLGLLLANKELLLDDVGEFMEKYGLQRHQKSLVSKYMRELKYDRVQEVCKPVLQSSTINELSLQKGLLCAFLKFKTIESWSLMIAKLLTLLVAKDESELGKVCRKISDLQMEDSLIQQVADHTNYRMQALNQFELLQVARCVYYNKLTQTINSTSNADPYLSFKIKDQTQIVRLNQFLHETEMNSSLSGGFNEVMKCVSKDIKGDKLIEVYGLDANFAEFNTTMIWEVINSFQSQIAAAPDAILKKLDKITITIGNQTSLEKGIHVFLNYLFQVAKIHQKINGLASYILNHPEDYIRLYADELYFIDLYYRKAIEASKKIELSEMPSTINWEEIHLGLNRRYEKHTDELNREWLKCLHQLDFDYARIPVAKQFNFFKTEIEPLNQKVVVIISDALRYEVATELLSELHGDSKNTATIKQMIASIPSKTNIGMAQLLPTDNLLYNNGEITNSKISTEGIINRNLILQKFKADTLAIQYIDIIKNSIEENRKIFKNSVVYVYHDIIDSTGDKRVSERRAFDVVPNAIEDISRLVKSLHASYNVAKVFITADHGFLYNDREIEERDLENIADVNPQSSHNRYYITEKPSNQELGYSIPLSKTTAFKDNDIFVTIPFSVNRYRKQGVGHQFVHGGGSLQELITPLIESSRKREDVVTKVKPVLLKSGILKVVSNVIRLNILQESKVSRLEKEVNLSIGLYSNNSLVSNEVISLLNFTSDSPTERMLQVELTLNIHTAKSSFLKLKIFDVEDKLNPLIEETVQNNTLIQSDF